MEHNIDILKQNGRNRRKTNMKCKFIKVDSPIAKYDSLGILSCIICKIPIKPNVWKVHLNSKQHKQNVEQAKRHSETDNKSQITSSIIPKDAPQHTKCITQNEVQSLSESEQSRHIPTANKNPVLPEKFFDNEKTQTVGSDINPDAEWLKFQREIREADNVSSNIVSEEQENVNIQRHLKEIDEQIENWKRFIKINDKKKSLSKSKPKETKRSMFDNESSSGEEGNVDDLWNWRKKSVHK